MSTLQQMTRVLIPRFDAFGDIIMLGGFLEAIREKLPDAELCMLVREGYDELALLFPPELKLRWLTVNFQVYIKPSDQILSQEQETYITPSEQMRSQYLETLQHLVTVGWDTVLLTIFNRTWLDNLLLEEFAGVNTIMLGSETDVHNLSSTTREVVPVNEYAHETDKYRVLLERLTGDSFDSLHPHLTVSDTLAEGVRQELSRLNLENTTFVACLPVGIQNNPAKAWPLERFAEVLTWLNDHHGLIPLLVGHKQEEAPIRSLQRMLSKSGIDTRIWLGDDGDIPMLGALLQQSSLYFGNDSGPMHMAAALGVPVVAVFGGGWGFRFVPANMQTLAIFAEIPCFGCTWKCIFKDIPCVRLVDVESVKKGLELVIKDEIPAGRILNIGEQFPKELIEIVEFATKSSRREKKIRAALNYEQSNCLAFQKSMSWRLTAPFRWLFDRLKFDY